MKKLVSLMLAAVMCLSLAACGGPDKQPAIDAYNNAATAVNALVEIMNNDIDTYADYIDTMNQIVDDLNEVADVLENEKLDKNTLDELVTKCQLIEEMAIDVRGDLEG